MVFNGAAITAIAIIAPAVDQHARQDKNTKSQNFILFQVIYSLQSLSVKDKNLKQLMYKCHTSV